MWHPRYWTPQKRKRYLKIQLGQKYGQQEVIYNTCILHQNLNFSDSSGDPPARYSSLPLHRGVWHTTWILSISGHQTQEEYPCWATAWKLFCDWSIHWRGKLWFTRLPTHVMPENVLTGGYNHHSMGNSIRSDFSPKYFELCSYLNE